MEVPLLPSPGQEPLLWFMSGSLTQDVIHEADLTKGVEQRSRLLTQQNLNYGKVCLSHSRFLQPQLGLLPWPLFLVDSSPD